MLFFHQFHMHLILWISIYFMTLSILFSLLYYYYYYLINFILMFPSFTFFLILYLFFIPLISFIIFFSLYDCLCQSTYWHNLLFCISPIFVYLVFCASTSWMIGYFLFQNVHTMSCKFCDLIINFFISIIKNILLLIFRISERKKKW